MSFDQDSLFRDDGELFLCIINLAILHPKQLSMHVFTESRVLSSRLRSIRMGMLFTDSFSG